jgi:hypothetical protein
MCTPMRLGLVTVLVVLVACKASDPAGALFEACYRRCMAPPAGECPTTHDWCVRACRTGDDGPPHAIAHLPRAGETPAGEPSILVRSLGLETVGGVYTPMIPRCALLPADHDEIFSTALDKQQSVEVTVLTGESPRVSEDMLLGRFTLGGIRPAPRGVPQINVHFHVERGGAVSVSAKDVATGQSQSISVVR